MTIRISKRGVAGKDLNTAWTSGAPASGLTKNIHRWGAGGADDGFDEVGLVPFAYVHWGNGSAGNSTINRRWNVSSISTSATGRWTVNFDTDWSLLSEDYTQVVPFVNAQRYNSGTSVTSIAHCSISNSNRINYYNFSIYIREVGSTAVAYRNPAYAWALVLGPGKLENVAASSSFKLSGSKISKSYTSSGNSTMQPVAYTRVNSGSIPSSGVLSVGGYYPSISSFTKIAIGRYSWNSPVTVDGDGGNNPMIFAMGDRPGTTTPAKVSIPSNVTYSTASTTFRNHNTANTQLDFNAHIVMF